MASAEPPLFDYAVVGAGVSGLALSWLLSARPELAGRSILLIDGARDDDELRTLSFWAPRPIALEELVTCRWQRLRIEPGAGAAGFEVAPAEHSYRTLLFADLQRATKARLAAAPQHQVIDGRLGALHDRGDRVELEVGERRLAARWVFDSRFALRDLLVDERRHHFLRQHFHGWVVRTRADRFDPGVATLIDFRVPGAPGTTFLYLLPRSPREALVELVSLHPLDAEPVLRGYLERCAGVSGFDIVDREAGISPQTEQPFAWRSGPRVRRIGIASGRLKPSTGYALTRILDECEAIVRSLVRRGHPMVPPRTSALYRLLDAVLLEVWQRRPALIPALFGALFNQNPADRVLRFLDERAGLLEVLQVGLSLPSAPMLAAVVRLLGRRLALRPRMPAPPAAPGPTSQTSREGSGRGRPSSRGEKPHPAPPSEA